MYKQGTFHQGTKRIKITADMIESGNIPDSLLVESPGPSAGDEGDDDLGDDDIDDDEEGNE